MATDVVLRPDADDELTSWTPSTGATAWDLLDEEPYSDSDYVQTSSTTADGRCMLSVNALPSMVSIVSVAIYLRCKKDADVGNDRNIHTVVETSASTYTNGSNTLITGTAIQEITETLLVNPATGLAWTVAEINACTWGFESQLTAGTGDNLQVTYFKVTVRGTLVPSQLSSIRDAGTRRIIRRRRPRVTVKLKVRLAVGLDLELLDTVALSHYAWPSTDGNGAGVLAYQRQDMVVVGKSYAAQAGWVELTLEDARWYRFLYFDAAYTDVTPGTWEQGVLRAGIGQTVSFGRSTKAWHVDPASGLVTERAQGAQGYAYGVGLYLEEARTNVLPRSSFVDELTGWTTTGNTTASSSPPEQLFDVVSAYAASLAGNGVSVPSAQIAAVSTVTGTVTISVDYRKSGTGTEDLNYRLSRSSDGKFYDGSAWQVGTQTVSIGNSTTRTRYQFALDVGAGAETLTLHLRGAVNTSGRIWYVYHCQVEEGPFASSRIVTGSAAVTRALDAYTISHTTAIPFLNVSQGTFACRVTFEWNSTDLATGAAYFLYCEFGANDWFKGFYDFATGSWNFQVRAAGTTTTATLTAAVTRGTTYRVSCRWTGSNGELGLTAYTRIIRVDGTSATVTGAANPTSASCTAEIGAVSGASILCGAIRDIVSKAVVLEDAECDALP